MASSVNPGTGSLDLRERSFQNVIDTILRPSGIKVGGFPEEMFLDLDEDDKERLTCNICYLIINECRQCDNNHSFCRSCIVAWTLTYGENSQKCPFCRCHQIEYHPDKAVDKLIGEKRVKCMEDGCSFKAPLKIYLLHSHGKTAFSNADVDFDKLRPRPTQMFLISPFPLSSQTGRASGIREHLLQGRMMIQQMMLLMHLEMQLRQQALVSYEETNEPAVRLQRLDDVMALNEQLNEVGSILSMLLSTPISRFNGNQEARLQDADNTSRFSGVDLLQQDQSPTDSSSDSSRSSSSSAPSSRLSESFSDSAADAQNHEAVGSTTPARILSLSNQRGTPSSSLPDDYGLFSDTEENFDFVNRHRSPDMSRFSVDGGDGNRGAIVLDLGFHRSRLADVDMVPSLDLESNSRDRTGAVDRGTLLSSSERGRDMRPLDFESNSHDRTGAVERGTLLSSSGRGRGLRLGSERRSYLLSRDQEFGLRLSSPETGESTPSFHSQGPSILSGLDETTFRQSLTTLPRINTTSSLMTSAEVDEANDTVSDRQNGQLLMSSSSSSSQSFADQLSSRNEHTSLELQPRNGNSSTSLSESQRNLAVANGSVTSSRVVPSLSHSVLRNEEPAEESGQGSEQAISSLNRPAGQGLHRQEQSLKQKSRPRFVRRNVSNQSEEVSENATGYAYHTPQTNTRALPKPNSVRGRGISRMSSQFLNRSSLNHGSNRPLTPNLANSPSASQQLRHSSSPNAAPKVVPVPHPPGVSGFRRSSEQAPPVTGNGRASLMRSRRRSEIRQELMKPGRHDD